MSTKRFALDGEFYVPAGLAIITVVYLISAIQLGPPMKDGNMTASFFPILTSVVMLIALVCAMVQALARKSSDGSEDEATAETSRTSKRYAGISLGAIGVVLLTAGYLLAFDLIGYFVSTFFYVLLLHGLFSGSIKKNWLMKLVATLLITAAGYLLFEVFFQVRLPTLWSQ